MFCWQKNKKENFYFSNKNKKKFEIKENSIYINKQRI